jgi:pimeloyl-ACP methyl ester carboxylesterase
VVAALRSLFFRPWLLPEEWYAAAADEFLRVFNTPRGRIAFFSALREIYLDEAYGPDGFWDRLSTLSRPSLFVWGRQDKLVPARFANHVLKCLPNASSVVLDDCGHVPQFERKEQTHRLLRQFLINSPRG